MEKLDWLDIKQVECSPIISQNRTLVTEVESIYAGVIEHFIERTDSCVSERKYCGHLLMYNMRTWCYFTMCTKQTAAIFYFEHEINIVKLQTSWILNVSEL